MRWGQAHDAISEGPLRGVRREKAALFQWVQIPPGETLQPEATGAGIEETICLYGVERWLSELALALSEETYPIPPARPTVGLQRRFGRRGSSSPAPSGATTNDE